MASTRISTRSEATMAPTTPPPTWRPCRRRRSRAPWKRTSLPAPRRWRAPLRRRPQARKRTTRSPGTACTTRGTKMHLMPTNNRRQVRTWTAMRASISSAQRQLVSGLPSSSSASSPSSLTSLCCKGSRAPSSRTFCASSCGSWRPVSSTAGFSRRWERRRPSSGPPVTSWSGCCPWTTSSSSISSSRTIAPRRLCCTEPSTLALPGR
mmetsp:Transcript_39077/g.99848  ORF Transcript_39077/g.99848 Transcript_39077/m.99848 type:complete len:208 (-) Transcript_39077:488-1111(-)